MPVGRKEGKPLLRMLTGGPIVLPMPRRSG